MDRSRLEMIKSIFESTEVILKDMKLFDLSIKLANLREDLQKKIEENNENRI